MHRMWLRAGLLSILLGAGVASGYSVFLSGQRIADSRRAERAYDARAWRIALSLAELRAAQQAYVAMGQDRGYWVADVGARIGNVTAELSDLAAASRLPAAVDALDEGASLVEALARMDVRARDHMTAGQELMASDLIFADGLELGRNAADYVERARLLEREARDAAAGGEQQAQVVAVGGALGASVLFAFLLSSLRHGPAAKHSAESPAEAAPATALPAGRLFLDAEPEAGNRAAEADPVADAPPTRPEPDLRLAADLCTDLGRSATAAELPPLLARAAQLLNASCIIVWVRDGTGNALRPAIGHGYPVALARLGTLPCDSDNATATAYREERMLVIPRDTETPGAIAAPLASPADRPGVMTLELSDGWEASAAVQSTATIIAAQLGTLVAADPASTSAEHVRA